MIYSNFYYTLRLRRRHPVEAQFTELDQAIRHLQQFAHTSWVVGIYHPATNNAWLPDVTVSAEDKAFRVRWLTEYFALDEEPKWQGPFPVK